MKYKNGKLKEVFNSKSTRGARLLTNCWLGTYQPSAGPPAQLTTQQGAYGSENGGNELIPQYFHSIETNSWYELTWVSQTDCGSGDPNAGPFKDLDTPEAYWLMSTLGGGGSGGGATYPPVDPYSPIPFDEGMPMNLDEFDSFLWMCRNAIGNSIIFNGAEEVFLRNNYDMYLVAKYYVGRNGRKPDMTPLMLNPANATVEQLQDAIDKMMPQLTPPEKQLLGINTPAFLENLRKYYKDSKEATWRTILRYNLSYEAGFENSVGKPNAFKHALKAAFHARPGSFGRTMAKQLVDAHENGSTSLDSQMDNWNNDYGLSMFDNNPSASDHQFDDNCWQLLHNGQLHFIKWFQGVRVIAETNQPD